MTPPLFGAAVSEDTARVVGSWADGLMTVNQEPAVLRHVIDAFREGGGDGKPVHVQVHLSWADDEPAALAIAHDQWRTNMFGSELMWDLELPSQFDAPEPSMSNRRTSAAQYSCLPTPGQHAEWIDGDRRLGRPRHLSPSRRSRTAAIHRRVRRARPAGAHPMSIAQDERSMVEERRHLLPRRRDLPRLER